MSNKTNSSTPNNPRQPALTKPQRAALELLATDNANCGYFGTIFDADGETIGRTNRSTLKALLKRNFISDHPTKRSGYAITPAGRAALLPADTQAAHGTTAAEPEPGSVDISWDDPRALAALNDIAAFVAGPQPDPLPQPDGAASPEPDALANNTVDRFDVLLDAYEYQRERWESCTDYNEQDYQFDRLTTAEKELCQWVEQHAAAIRAALTAAAPSEPLRAGDTAVVVWGWRLYDAQHSTLRTDIFEGAIVTLIAEAEQGEWWVEWKSFKDSIPARYLRRVDGGEAGGK